MQILERDAILRGKKGYKGKGEGGKTNIEYKQRDTCKDDFFIQEERQESSNRELLYTVNKKKQRR